MDEKTLLTTSQRQTARYSKLVTFDRDAKDQWLGQLEEECPEYKHVRETTQPLARTLAFARHYSVKPQYDELDILSDQNNTPSSQSTEIQLALALIIEHLALTGMTQTSATLQMEAEKRWGFNPNQVIIPDSSYYKAEPAETRLHKAIRNSVRRIQNAYDCILGKCDQLYF